jgi:oligopeptide/dipeptide ABC transporter ATP-binding protein
MLVQLVPQSQGTIEYYPPADGSDGPGAVPATPWKIRQDDPQTLRRYRSKVKYVFQDPSSALDPRMSAYRILTSAARYSDARRSAARYSGAPLDERAETGVIDLRDRASATLQAVGLREADLDRRPSEFSGGQRQRLSLARALFSNPTALICDEVVSALDVSIQGQILNLLADLKRQFNLTILFIAHDLTVVSYMADRVCVLYGGSIMEEAPAETLERAPAHPYTKLLYRTVPRLGQQPPERDREATAAYQPTRPPLGCPFVGRCPIAQPICSAERPALREIAAAPRVACHFA